MRPACPADLGQVAEIFGWYAVNSLVTFEESPRPHAEWARHATELAELGLPFLVAETGGEIAGYAYAGPWRRKPAYRLTVENSVFVAPGRTGSGTGRRLLTELLANCAEAGLRQVVAVIADSGEPASVGLHLACGFTEAGRLTGVGFKHGRWIDTLLMQRTLGTDPP
ncbi:MAG TPA: GNAT family N-acetyltransferase [Streptosporangiaceae bacterium]|nr:GNAT family N-acetyltransferase [Streptosporangiaceae bacterium]